MIYNTVKELFTAICDSIRAKKGSHELINHQDIPNEVIAVYEKGVKDTLDNYSFSVNGTFIPGDGVKEFSIEGLPFTPTSLMLISSEETAAGSNRAPNTFIYTCVPKGLYGGMLYTDTVGNRLGNIPPTASAFQWSESGVTFTIPPTLEIYFKKGSVYYYYITGDNK